MNPTPITALLDALDAVRIDGRPIVVAIDGRSGAGKSTLAADLVSKLSHSTIVDGDSFYAGGDGEQWDAMTDAEKAEHCIDWRRQRPVIEALRAGRTASWRGFDWQAFDGRLERELTIVEPAPIVVLEGVYSGRPQLADLMDLRVLVSIDEGDRLDRLRRREADQWHDGWHARWSAAEDHYFAETMPPSAFDLVL